MRVRCICIVVFCWTNRTTRMFTFNWLFIRFWSFAFVINWLSFLLNKQCLFIFFLNTQLTKLILLRKQFEMELFEVFLEDDVKRNYDNEYVRHTISIDCTNLSIRNKKKSTTINWKEILKKARLTFSSLFNE